jgi:hypothetical protein
MKTMRITLGVVALILIGCSAPSAVMTSARDLPLYGVDPLYHTVYVGSDEGFHYFRWSRGLGSGSYIVPRDEIVFDGEFVRGEGQVFLTRGDDGSIRFHPVLGGGSRVGR